MGVFFVLRTVSGCVLFHEPMDGLSDTGADKQTSQKNSEQNPMFLRRGDRGIWGVSTACSAGSQVTWDPVTGVRGNKYMDGKNWMQD